MANSRCHEYLSLGPGIYCSPRHQPHFEATCLESNGTLQRGDQCERDSSERYSWERLAECRWGVGLGRMYDSFLEHICHSSFLSYMPRYDVLSIICRALPLVDKPHAEAEGEDGAGGAEDGVGGDGGEQQAVVETQLCKEPTGKARYRPRGSVAARLSSLPCHVDNHTLHD